MDWLSLCVCGTKRNDRKIKKDGKRKKGKKCKKNSKQKGSRKPPPFIVEEFLRKSQDEQPKEIADKEWSNGEIVNYFNDCAKSQIGSIDQNDSPKINGSSSYQIGDDHENFEESLKNSERNADESVREPCDVDYYGNVMLHSRCASSITDENEDQVKCISDENEYDEELDLDESIPRAREPEDSSWTSEIEDSRDTVLESSFDRKVIERISSRINFSKQQEGKSKAIALPKKKGTRKILPPIKRTSRAEVCTDNEELQAQGETNKFGFKRTAASHERIEVRRKLNSCSFEVRPFEEEERSGKTRIRGEGSMIPRLASPRQGINSTKNVSNKSENMQNGTLLRIKNDAHRIFDKEKLEVQYRLLILGLGNSF